MVKDTGGQRVTHFLALKWQFSISLKSPFERVPMRTKGQFGYFINRSPNKTGGPGLGEQVTTSAHEE